MVFIFMGIVIGVFIAIYRWWTKTNDLKHSFATANNEITELKNEITKLNDDIKTHLCCIEILQNDVAGARQDLQKMDQLQKENVSLTELVQTLTVEKRSLQTELTTIKKQKAEEYIQNLEREKQAALERENEYSKKLMNEQACLKERMQEIDTLKQQAEDSKLCVICEQVHRSVVFVPCGHCCSCKTCFDNLPRKLCPLCRQTITSTQSIFM